MDSRKLDVPIFVTAFLVVLFVCVPIMVWPQQAGGQIQQTYDWIAENFGLLYQWVVIGIVGFLGWIALSRHGEIRLGDPDERPEFSHFGWVSMLFCAGVGAGLLYWATIEWGYYMATPPFGAEPNSEEAIAWATSYGLFHWGYIAWAIYALPTVAIAFPYYVKKVPYLRLSTSCHSFWGAKGKDAIGARIVDGVFMLALIGGAGTSMGLAVPMVSANLADAVGLERSFMLDVGVVAVCVALFAFSVYAGLEKGIKRLADLNVSAALIFLLFVLLAGPTLFILRVGTESIGFMLDNMFRMLTWTDPIARTRFVEDWTIFYWAWWIAFGPFVGVFITRISRGRTLRQLIGYMAVFGSLGAWAFYIVLGNYALFLDLNNVVPVRDVLANGDPAAAIASVIGELPLGPIAQVVFASISIIFIATTYDSASYALASAASAQMGVGDDPARWNRLFWALVLGLLPVALMAVDGGVKVIMSAVLVASLPLIIVAIMMCVNLGRSVGSPATVSGEQKRA
ncbi:MAG: BCCT family transporter [Pseudomonadota bacterium]